MKNKVVLLGLALCLLWLTAVTASTPVVFYPAKVAVLFSPKGGCTDAIVKEIEEAKHEVWVQAYYLTSSPIGEALAKARAIHRVNVKVIVDKETVNNQASVLPTLSEVGIPLWVDTKEITAHSKVIIIDDKTIIAGSFNFTKAAEEKNSEILLIIKESPENVLACEKNITKHLEHSIPLAQWKEEHKEKR